MMILWLHKKKDRLESLLKILLKGLKISKRNTLIWNPASQIVQTIYKIQNIGKKIKPFKSLFHQYLTTSLKKINSINKNWPLTMCKIFILIPTETLKASKWLKTRESKGFMVQDLRMTQMRLGNRIDGTFFLWFYTFLIMDEVLIYLSVLTFNFVMI